MESTVFNTDVTERTDLRILDAHHSAREVYAAQWCPYPGTLTRGATTWTPEERTGPLGDGDGGRGDREHDHADAEASEVEA